MGEPSQGNRRLRSAWLCHWDLTSKAQSLNPLCRMMIPQYEGPTFFIELMATSLDLKKKMLW